MNSFYKNIAAPLALVAGMTGLAGIVGAEERKITRDETQSITIKLNQDRPAV